MKIIQSKINLTLNYTLFAIIATIANIGTQDIIIRFYNGTHNITFSILAGTCVGLFAKYFLDKKYIFQFNTKNIKHDSKIFFLYTFMGVITTLIFWCFELGFEYIFKTKELRYLGGIIGLSIGYTIKYRLDKQYVFTQRAN